MTSATFAGEIGKIKARYEEERWRMGVTKGLAYWREFVSGWASAASSLRSSASGEEVPEEVLAGGDQSVLSWAWALVEHEVNSVLFAVDLRTAIPSAVVVSHFRVMSGNGLILPDGSCCSYVLRAVERSLSVDEANENRIIAASAAQSARLRNIMAERGKKGPRK